MLLEDAAEAPTASRFTPERAKHERLLLPLSRSAATVADEEAFCTHIYIYNHIYIYISYTSYKICIWLCAT